MRTRVEMADVVRLFGAGLVSKTSLTPLQFRITSYNVCYTKLLRLCFMVNYYFWKYFFYKKQWIGAD